jgi:4-hydroxy-tetrahydrodipicolinate synthase
MTACEPWQGVVVTLPTPFRADLTVDLGRLQEHVAWLAGHGCRGVAPCGPLGEYQSLSDAERADVVRATVAAAPPGCAVLPGAGGYGSREARRWAEQALAAGAHAVLVPPPDGYAARDTEVLAHFREVAAVGLPVIAYDDPAHARVDLTPELLARVAETDGVVAVQEVGGDVRRLHRIRDLIPHLDVLAGTDDVLLELVVCGARGWMAATANVLPEVSVRLYELCAAQDLATALPLYAGLHPVLGWGSAPGSVQAVKLGMDLAGRYGGPCRPPRGPLSATDEARLRGDLVRAVRGKAAVLPGDFPAR